MIHTCPLSKLLTLLALCCGLPTNSLAADSSTNIWVQGFTDSSEQDDRGDVNGFDADSQGVAFGIDHNVTENASLGVAFSRTNADVDSDRFGRDDIRSDEYSLYGAIYFGNAYFSASANYSDGQTSRNRELRVEIDSVIRFFPLRSNIDTSQYSGQATVGWNFALSENVNLSPFAGLSYSVLDTDDYIERSGTDLSLLVQTEDEKQLIGSLGLSLGYSHIAGDWLVAPEIHVSFEHNLKRDDTSSFSQLRGRSFGFESRGLSVEANRFRAGLSLSLTHYGGFSLQLGVETETKDDYRYLSALLGLRYGF